MLHAMALGLFFTAVFCMLSEPMEDSTTWYIDFLVSKGIGVVAILSLVGMNRYRKEIEDWCESLCNNNWED